MTEAARAETAAEPEAAAPGVAAPAVAAPAAGALAGSRRRLLAGTAMAGVLLTSADTYVVVLALPAIMTDVGVTLDRLAAATPIISGFLLGYVVVMPLLGRLSDRHGRRPLLLGCLAVFAAGSLVTASASDLASVVAGRALQGLGGGGLVPITLALVADLWPPRQRGLPLGAAGAAQELGSVAGPLYGALVLSLATWRAIFWLNLPLAGLLALLLAAAWRGPAADRSAVQRPTPRPLARLDVPGVVLAALAVLAGGLCVAAPPALLDSAIFGSAYTPLLGASWLSPLLLVAIGSALLFTLWELRGAPAHRRLLDPRRAVAMLRAADWPGSLLAALALTGIVVSFAGGDASQQVLSPAAPWWLAATAVAALLFLLRERSAADPLVELPALRPKAAHGALLMNLAAGAALIAAMLDVPILARATVDPNSQLAAALVLLRLLAAIPVGAVLGGWLLRRVAPRWVAAAGLLLAAAMLALMTRWTASTLGDPLGPAWLHPSDPVLVACGLGFGLAIAPAAASLLDSVPARLHGLASSLLVVARMVGMLVGVSVLTAVGLHAFHEQARRLPSPLALCPHSPLSCAPYDSLVTGAVVAELRTVFLGAAACAGLGALLALLLRGSSAGRATVRARA